MAQAKPASDTFTTHDIAEGVAHDLVLQAEEAVQAARGLPIGDPARLWLMNAASAALAAATPFVPSPPILRVARARRGAAAGAPDLPVP